MKSHLDTHTHYENYEASKFYLIFLNYFIKKSNKKNQKENFLSMPNLITQR